MSMFFYVVYLDVFTLRTIIILVNPRHVATCRFDSLLELKRTSLEEKRQFGLLFHFHFRTQRTPKALAVKVIVYRFSKQYVAGGCGEILTGKSPG